MGLASGLMTPLTRLGATALGVVNAATMGAVKVGDGSHGIMRLDADARLSLSCIPSIPRPIRLSLGVARRVDSPAPDDQHESALSPEEENAGEAEIV